MLQTWISDARFAARRLRKRPTYAFIAVLTLALGIGGTTAVFAIGRPLIVDPLPYANADHVVTFWMSGWWNEEEFLFLRDKFSSFGFRAVGAVRSGDVTMRNGDAPSRLISGRQVTAELFDVLGARPLFGRSFRQGDDVVGADPIAVISYGLWQELGGNTSVIGQRVTLDGTPRTIVGVMPRNFWFPDPSARIWLPKALDPVGRNGSWMLVGQLAPGMTSDHMGPQLAQLTRAIGERFHYAPKADKTIGAKLTPLRETLLGSIRPAVVATFVAMALILLIACANVAALMLGQVEGRSSEMAVRSALGASAGRLTQQVVIEALLLGVVAAVLGAALAAAGFRILAQSLPIGAWGESATFDWTMFAVALAIAIGAVLLVVLVPTVSLRRSDLRGTMNSAKTGGIQGRGGRLERGLVVGQVALAMLIISGAALLARSVTKLYAIDPGFETAGIAVVDVVSSREMDVGLRRQKIEETATALAELPGVRSTAAAMKLPLRSGGDSFGITVEGRENQERSFTNFRIVTAGYFATMGIKLRDGRSFDVSDQVRDSGGSVVINEALAKRYFPGENPIGKRLRGGFSGSWTVIGVVQNVAEADLTDEDAPTRYYLAQQVDWFGNAASFVIRAARQEGAEALLDGARQTVNRVAPAFAVSQTTTASRIFDIAVGPARQIMTLLALLSGLALVLGAVGIYGVISHFATRRKRDWAIRVALGLPGVRVVTHIVAQGVRLVAVGIIFGIFGTLALSRLLTTFLFGVSQVDPLALIAASSALLLVGALAAVIPARRAGTVDPALVLREQ
ncbi:MAG: permease [Gemmatimonadetes bacterium]|nr:permease [Gemmatimonadota bacterium]